MARTLSSSRTLVIDDTLAGTFHEHYPQATLRSAGLSSLPEIVVAHFDLKSRLHILPQQHSPKNFSSCAAIHHDDKNGLTYVVTLQKTYENNDKTEQLIYLADVDRNDVFLGYGEVRFPSPLDDSRRQRHFPFVGYTETFPDFQRRGLGTRRLLVMNALAYASYGLPLQSDTLIVKNARRLWQHLVEKDLACRVRNDADYVYYHFK